MLALKTKTALKGSLVTTEGSLNTHWIPEDRIELLVFLRSSQDFLKQLVDTNI